jgi:hypothetical protein
MDRLLDLLLTRAPKGREKALLEAAEPPLWVRLAFHFVGIAGLCGLLISIIHKAGWVSLPWDPAHWPDWFAFFALLMASRFAYREVHRHYGKRALREDWTTQ